MRFSTVLLSIAVLILLFSSVASAGPGYKKGDRRWKTTSKKTSTSTRKTSTKTTSTKTTKTTSTSTKTNGPGGATQSGDVTWYSVCNGCKGYVACGDADDDNSVIVAISKYWWNSAANPNNDALCTVSGQMHIKMTYKGKTIKVPVRDKCCGCKPNDLDFSPAAWKAFGLDFSVGRYHNMTWEFADYIPKYNGNPSGCPQTG
ncbi:hypothetical protein BC938DRAFT_476253 [Jimgerdemannia flammicorona]|uniref:RlpA-like double-psi beta-barrel-protein domain-containing protein-containing protein n=1 Tax=Jimgerdemannia flammicorona TaxID=994334 RepID=A0A433QQS8_9FUNG|nr:hypothetical protein BC938DRAFT_476253 [Jimgerdemannia flammicorona]